MVAYFRSIFLYSVGILISTVISIISHYYYYYYYYWMFHEYQCESNYLCLRCGNWDKRVSLAGVTVTADSMMPEEFEDKEDDLINRLKALWTIPASLNLLSSVCNYPNPEQSKSCLITIHSSRLTTLSLAGCMQISLVMPMSISVYFYC